MCVTIIPDDDNGFLTGTSGFPELWKSQLMWNPLTADADGKVPSCKT